MVSGGQQVRIYKQLAIMKHIEKKMVEQLGIFKRNNK
jgi:hypothetical protein